MENWKLLVIIVVAAACFIIVTVAICCLCWRRCRKGRNDFNYQSYIDDDVESQRRASSNGRTRPHVTRPHVKHPSRAKTVNEEKVRRTKGAGRKPRIEELPRVSVINDDSVSRYLERRTTTSHAEFGRYLGRETTNNHAEFDRYLGRETTTSHAEFGRYLGRETTTSHAEFGRYLGRETTTSHAEFGRYLGRETTNNHAEFGRYLGRETTTSHAEFGRYLGRETTTSHADFSRYLGRETTTGEGNLSHTIHINGGNSHRSSKQGITVRKGNVSSGTYINEPTQLPGVAPVRESMAQWLSQQQKALNKFTSANIHKQKQTTTAQRPAATLGRNSVQQFTSASKRKFNTLNGYRKSNTCASTEYREINFSTSPEYSQSDVSTSVEYPKLDLHNYTLKEAIKIFKTFLRSSISDYQNSNYIRNKRFCLVITGRGKHSTDGVPVIKPAVENYLKTHNYTYNWSNPGMVRIDLLPFREMADSD
ncbi:hypothetical protein BsWGS_18291 [Bradybaena similaris]